MPSDRKPLTLKQSKVYVYIHTQITKHHVPPTIRDIMNHFGYASTNSARNFINALIRKGWIYKKDRTARNLRLRK